MQLPTKVESHILASSTKTLTCRKVSQKSELSPTSVSEKLTKGEPEQRGWKDFLYKFISSFTPYGIIAWPNKQMKLKKYRNLPAEM